MLIGQPYTLKIAMLGESGVGKTCIIDRYVNDSFNEFSDPTKGASFKAKVLVSTDGTTEVKLMIWDTAGQEIYKSLTPFYYKDADIIILVYDITNKESFDALSYWQDEIKQHALPECLITVVGNKSDMFESEIIGMEEAKAKAVSMGASFFTVSAKEDLNIKDLFLDTILRKFPLLRPKFGYEEEEPKIDAVLETKPRGVKIHTSETKLKKKSNCKCQQSIYITN